MTRTVRIARLFAVSVVAALVLTAAATAAGPALSAGAGCSVACIESALVTTTASSARVEVKTSVATSVSATVRKADEPLGLTSGPGAKHISLPAFLKTRTILFSGLEPATAYRIVVSARDVQGRTQSRSGTFTTRAVKVAVDTPGLGLSAGLGCRADCVERGTLTSDHAVPGRARLELRSSVPATFRLALVAKDSSGKVLHQLVHVTGSRKTAHTATLDGLLTGTTYAARVEATDAEGRTWTEQGTFRTRSAVAVVTFHKLAVLDDADKGIDRGEISFGYRAGELWAGGNGFHKIGSGKTVAATASGTSRPGVAIRHSIDGRGTLELGVQGVECDAVLMKNCVVEGGRAEFSGSYAGDLYVYTKMQFDLRSAFSGQGALPPGYGTGLPAGHDGYAVWETTTWQLKFRVYATVDVELVG